MTPTRDANGSPLRAGDTVRLVEGADLRTVEAVGREAHLAGYVMVSGLLGWRSGRQFALVKKECEK